MLPDQNQNIQHNISKKHSKDVKAQEEKQKEEKEIKKKKKKKKKKKGEKGEDGGKRRENERKRCLRSFLLTI